MRCLSKNKYPNIYYYDDGFSVGKGEKNYYKNLEYFFSKEIYTLGNTFSEIFYKSVGNKMEIFRENLLIYLI